MSDQEQHSGHSHSTFISGILVGILLALLFTTKRGRKLLSIITDEGIGKFHKWEDLLEMLESQVQGEIIPDEEPVMGEDLKEEVQQIEPPKKVEKKEEKKHKEEEKKAEETLVEKIEEKVKEVEELTSELREVKEAIIEKVQDSVPDKEKEAEAVPEEVSEKEDIPLHKALDPIIEEEAPKKKSRRLFKGIRRK